MNDGATVLVLKFDFQPDAFLTALDNNTLSCVEVHLIKQEYIQMMRMYSFQHSNEVHCR